MSAPPAVYWPGRTLQPALAPARPVHPAVPAVPGNRKPEVAQPFFGLLGLAAGGLAGVGYEGGTATRETALYTSAGAVVGGLAGMAAQNLYDRWYGPAVAIVTITAFDVDHPLTWNLSEDDQIVSSNFNRLKKRLPYSKKIKCHDWYDQPISLTDLQGVTTLYILGHGSHEMGSIGIMDVDDIAKLIAGSVLAEVRKGTTTDEKREIMRALWHIREINMVSCNSAVSGDQAINIAERLRDKLAVIARIVGFPIQVRGVDGYATVSHEGNVLRISRSDHDSWSIELNQLERDIKDAREQGNRLSSSEIRNRSREILGRYSSGVNNDFTTYQARHN